MPPPDSPRSPATHPWVIGAILLAGVAVISRPLGWFDAPAAAPSGTFAAPVPSYDVPCRPGTLPDAGVCVPVEERPVEAVVASELDDNSLPLRAGRPADFARYELPGAARSDAPRQIAPSSLEGTRADPRDAIVYASRPGGPLLAPRLEQQAEEARVLFADANGGTVMTLHTVTQGERREQYVVVLQRLGNVAVSEGDLLSPTTPLGTASDDGVVLGIRHLRAGAELAEAIPDLPWSDVIAVDPRNLLPLRPE